MTAEQAPELGKFVSLEQFLAAMDRIAAEAAERQREAAERQREAAERQKEAAKRQKEADRLRAKWQEEAEERKREADKQLEELKKVVREVGEEQKKNEKAIKQLSQNIGGLNNSMGGLVETLVAARLWRKFKQYHIRHVLQRISVVDENGRLKTDIDILLTNASCAIVVEVKRILKKGDVDEHLERMELVRQYPPEYLVNPNEKKLLGAVAGGTVARAVRKYAQECGLFVLELAGESVRMARSPEGFTPREW
jgi:ATPase subunit of ABC transporter with duplicated ATPase domains